MKRVSLFLFSFAVVACITSNTPEVISTDDRDQTYGLSLYVGKKSAAHDANFDAKAKELCGGGSYSVLERYYSSSTMADVSHDDYTYTWRIQCQ